MELFWKCDLLFCFCCCLCCINSAAMENIRETIVCVRYSFTDSRRSETEKTHIKQGMKKSFVFFSFFVSNASRAWFVGKVVWMDDALLMAWLVCCYSIQISLPFNRFGPRKKATTLCIYKV